MPQQARDRAALMGDFKMTCKNVMSARAAAASNKIKKVLLSEKLKEGKATATVTNHNQIQTNSVPVDESKENFTEIRRSSPGHLSKAHNSPHGVEKQSKQANECD